MTKRRIVINRCYGGFGLSDEAIELYAELKGIILVKSIYPNTDGPLDTKEFYFINVVAEGNMFEEYDIERDDPALVEVVIQLKDRANGNHAELMVVEIPADVSWNIANYDGYEHVEETHRVWPETEADVVLKTKRAVPEEED